MLQLYCDNLVKRNFISLHQLHKNIKLHFTIFVPEAIDKFVTLRATYIFSELSHSLSVFVTIERKKFRRILSKDIKHCAHACNLIYNCEKKE